jgi:23S rRNA (cytidine2498-2'-O)-methyltransferase
MNTRQNPDSFAFAVCSPGSEHFLREEWARLYPELRFAYSRPGFVTFKAPSQAEALRLALDEPESVFARVSGITLGKFIALEEALDAAQKLLAPKDPFIVHAWKQPNEATPTPEVPKPGQWVLNWMEVRPGEFWAGAHRHGQGRFLLPGGFVPLELPADAPSRAWFKIEEAIRLFRLPFRERQMAVELGAAPGGASFALLERGLKVVGVDPAEMHPRIAQHPSFRHLRMPASQLTSRDLPDIAHWILLDMNVAPQVTVRLVERLLSKYSHCLRGAVLTLKLNEKEFSDEIPGWIERIRSLGFPEARGIQLPSHKQEIAVVGMAR